MDNFMAVLSAILPIMLLISAGYVLRRMDLMSAAGCAEIGRVIYWFALPCLLFVKLAVDQPQSPPWTGLLIGSACYGLSVLLVYVSSGSQSAAVRGSLATISFRCNAAFVGLPVVMLLIDNGICDADFASFYLLMLACIVTVFNVYSVLGFLLPHHGVDGKALARVGMGLLKNPLIWSCVLGILFSVCGWGPALKDNVLFRSMDLAGQASIPMALLMAGASLNLQRMRSGGLHFWFWNGWKMFLLPLLVYLICVLLQVDAQTMMALCILSACPGAVATVPMAQELGGDEELTAASVVITTLVSPLSLLVFILLAGAYAHG